MAERRGEPRSTTGRPEEPTTRTAQEDTDGAPGAGGRSDAAPPSTGGSGIRSDGWVRRMLPFVRPQRNSLIKTFVAGIVWAGVSTLVPVVERHVVDDVILSARSPLAPWLLLLFGLGVIGFVSARTRRFNSSRVMLEVSYG